MADVKIAPSVVSNSKMTRPKKRTALDEARQKQKNKRQHLALPQHYNTDLDLSSPATQCSEPENTYNNPDDELQLDQFMQKVEASRLIFEDNKTTAKNFEIHVEQRRSEILGLIKQHQEKLKRDRNAFEDVFLSVLISALEPMSLGHVDGNLQKMGDNKMKISTLTAHNLELFEYTEQLCRDTTGFLRLYSDVSRRDVPAARVMNNRDKMVTDKVFAEKCIAAGAKRSKLQVQKEFMVNGPIAGSVLEMTKDEENDAILFESAQEPQIEEDKGFGLGWTTFARKLTHAVQKIEQLASIG